MATAAGEITGPQHRPMSGAIVGRALAALLAGVWLYHGLWNKVLGGEPRHEAIVRSVPGLDGPAGAALTVVIGLVEVLFAVT